MECQALNLKRWNHAVSMLPSICVRGELHAKVWNHLRLTRRYTREVPSRGGSLIQS